MITYIDSGGQKYVGGLFMQTAYKVLLNYICGDSIGSPKNKAA